MAAPKCQGALSWRVPAQWEEPRPEGRRSRSRAPPCRRAQPDVPFAVPEETGKRRGTVYRDGIGRRNRRTADRNQLSRRRITLRSERRTIDKDTNHGGYSRKAWSSRK